VTALSDRPFRLAALAAVIIVAGGWIAYTHFWEVAGAKPLAYRDLTASLAPFEAPAQTARRFRRRFRFALYVSIVRPGEPLRLPRIDFPRDEAVLVSTGPRSSTGYALHLISAEEERGRLVIRFREQTPKLGDPQQARLTYPYRLIVFRNLHKPVYIELQGRQ
jgi:hypothetical protein